MNIRPGRDPDGWDMEIFIEPLVHLPAGPYPARSTRITNETVWSRPTVVVDFDIFARDVLTGPRLARLPMYCPLPVGSRKLTKRSKLGHWLTVAGLPLTARALPLEALRYKLWRVEVGDVIRDYERHPLGDDERYSVVRRVLESFS